ncbi:MAG: hypothetical protein AAF713_22630 [Pseudomonadota bacterium]
MTTKGRDPALDRASLVSKAWALDTSEFSARSLENKALTSDISDSFGSCFARRGVEFPHSINWEFVVDRIFHHPCWAPNENERGFIEDMRRRVLVRQPTKRQAAWIDAIDRRLQEPKRSEATAASPDLIDWGDWDD